MIFGKYLPSSLRRVSDKRRPSGNMLHTEVCEKNIHKSKRTAHEYASASRTVFLTLRLFYFTI